MSQSMSQWPEPISNPVSARLNTTTNSQRKPILVLDFDGVIHSYDKGWQDGKIYGTIVPGFFEWAVEAKKYFMLVIYSSRSESHKTRQPMEDWFRIQLIAWKWDNLNADLEFTDFMFPTYKPPTFLTIDDRAITFNGKWNDPQFNPEQLLKFKPWNHKE